MRRPWNWAFWNDQGLSMMIVANHGWTRLKWIIIVIVDFKTPSQTLSNNWFLILPLKLRSTLFASFLDDNKQNSEIKKEIYYFKLSGSPNNSLKTMAYCYMCTTRVNTCMTCIVGPLQFLEPTHCNVLTISRPPHHTFSNSNTEIPDSQSLRWECLSAICQTVPRYWDHPLA